MRATVSQVREETCFPNRSSTQAITPRPSALVVSDTVKISLLVAATIDQAKSAG
jgi:hypothetical protein